MLVEIIRAMKSRELAVAIGKSSYSNLTIRDRVKIMISRGYNPLGTDLFDRKCREYFGLKLNAKLKFTVANLKI